VGTEPVPCAQLTDAICELILLSRHYDQYNYRVQQVKTPRQKIWANIEGNFSHHQTSVRFVSSWLAFWSLAMHVPSLAKLQNVKSLALDFLNRQLAFS
jgi:hypothetical protein